jgi:hypothetical protein
MKYFRLFFIIVFHLTNTATAKSSIDPLFGSYEVALAKNYKKSPLNYLSDPIAKTFKTAISSSYKNGEINFSGHFITATWGCGAGCVSGAMVDIFDGKVYSLPWDENDILDFCGDIDQRISYQKNSRLIKTTACNLKEITIKNVDYSEQTIIYNYYLWDDAKKQFSKLKPVKKITRSKSLYDEIPVQPNGNGR